MSASVAPWIVDGNAGNALVTNRVVKFILTACGFDTSAVFTGFVPAFNVCAYGADPLGVTESTAAVQAAVTDAAVSGGLVYHPKGTYNRTGTVTIPSYGVRIVGADRRASFIKFNPAAPAVCWDFINVVTNKTLSNCGISDLRAISTNAIQKTWCQFTDVSEFNYKDVDVDQSWTSAGFDSIGLLIKGREMFRATRYTIFADRPVVFQQNPRDVTTFIDMDFFTFRDGYTRAATTQYNFFLDPTLRSVQHPKWDGLVMVGGLGGFSWNGAGATRDSQGWVLKDCRSEQMTGTGWFVDFSRSGFSIVGPQFINCAPSNVTNNGFRLRNTTHPYFNTIEWPDTTGTPKLFDFDATVTKIKWDNVWTQVGGAITLAGQTLVFGLTRANSVDLAIPTSAYYDTATNGATVLGNILMWMASSRMRLPTDPLLINTSGDVNVATWYQTGRLELLIGLTVGAAGTIVTQVRHYTPTLTPASVAAQSVVEQTFSVPGLTTADKVSINVPAVTNNIGIGGVRVSAADTLAVRFVNPTAGALTPTAGVYPVEASRS